MSRLTKVYKNGKVTIDAEQFPPRSQEAIDREVFNSEPIRAAVECLAELEDEKSYGKWKQSDLLPDIISCSECGCQRNPKFKLGLGHYQYCPNCGAKMEE